MFHQPTALAIRADTEVRTYALERLRYYSTMACIFIRKLTRYRTMLRSVAFLRPLTDADIAQLADALQPHIQGPQRFGSAFCGF
jgi:hypothetical protein